MDTFDRFFAFAVALIAVVGAFGAFFLSVGHVALEVEGPSMGLCDLASFSSEADDLVISAYLEANADQLEQPAGSDDAPVSFTIQSGESVMSISEQLEREGLIVDAELFRRYVQYHNLDAGIEAGEFTLRQTMTIPEIAQALQSGHGPEQMVTIPEGLRLEQVAARVAEQTTIPAEDFQQLATSGWRELGLGYAFLTELPPTATLEGFLFPETYRLPEDAAAIDLLERMLRTFDSRVTPTLRAAAEERGMSLYELVTLASIVEREAVLDQERPIIAGVYWNRLEADWTMDACPTVQYALGESGDWWPPFTLEATNVDSPYNTYRNRGLPPGPVCSPGAASIEAAARPADTDYFFFLVDCTKDDGSHLFSVTQEEHNANYQMCGGGAP